MLTPIDEVLTANADAVPASAKQICAQGSSSGAVIYTVPAGKQFRGFVSHERGNWGSGYYAEIINSDGGSTRHTGGFAHMGSSSYSMGASPELHLLAGTSVKNQGGSNNVCVFGVETDA